ncbi:MAG TPA: epoxide hydrolase [Rhodobiaceae bacterium]|nr:epoxide hydrolase [Rhodobiaceae bacterium]
MIDWHNPSYFDLPDLNMAVFEAGERSTDIPSLVLCHGWPELAYSWRKVVPILVEAGLHVIVPEQRGFGMTGKALSDAGDESGVPLYDVTHLTGDLVHLLDKMDIEKAIFTGHDLGGFVIWQMPFFHSARTAGLIGVNTPYVPRLSDDPIKLFRAAFGDDFYIAAFQEYGRAEGVFDADPAHILRMMYRKSGRLEVATELPGDSWERVELLNMLKGPEDKWPGVPLFDDTDFQYYVDSFKHAGFRGGINWYRNFSRNWQNSEGMEQKINHPSLMICAADDRVLPPRLAEGMPIYIDDLETHIIDACGHWTQNEQPEQLAALMKDWVLRRFT